MERYRIGDLTLMLGNLIATRRDLMVADRLGKRVADWRGGGAEYFNNLALTLDGLAIVCSNFQCDQSLVHQIRDVEASVKDETPDGVRESDIAAKLGLIIAGVQNNLESRAFLFVPRHMVTYYDNHLLFGPGFLDAYPNDAVRDMVQAGTCYSARLATACVFHSMRVAEHGLRKLARHVGAKITDKGKPCRIEYGTWDKVIQAIKNKIATARQRPSGPARQRRLEFYSAAADHCEYMKDIWRNEVSHTRREYKQAEALAVLNRVKDFVLLLVDPMPR
jgi:hypothetical protein